MSESPTTAGSIVGKLRLDKSEWDRDKASAKADAAELARLDPTIKVDANVGEALAGVEAVRLAQERLGFENDRLKIAYQRLDEVQTKGGASQSKLMSLHLAAAKAEAAQEAATRALAAAQANLADENDRVDESNQRVTSSAGGALQRWQMIAIAIAALIPLLAPLAGYVVGVGGALAGMGAAGVLAIFGVIAAIKRADDVGKQYKVGLDQLKGSFDNLASTAATRMLGAFQDAVQRINAALPQLNTQVGVFSTILGNAGNNVLQAVINALQILNPLFVQGAQYVDQLAQGFLAWTENGGLKAFADYATGMFPQVAATLGNLVSLVMNLVAAAAPLGGPILGALNGISQALGAIPTPVLTALIAGAFGAAVAFKSWSAISPTIDKVGGSLDGVRSKAVGAMGTIVSLAAAADTAILQLTASAANSVHQWQGLTQGSDQWSEAIRKGNINVDNLGLTLQRTGGFWNDFANNADVAGTAIRPYYDNVKALDQALASATPADLAIAYKQLQTESQKAGQSQATLANLFPMGTAAIHAQKQAASDAAKATGDNAVVVDKLGAASDAAKASLDKFNQALQGLGQANLSASQANIQYNQSLADTNAAIAQNGKSLDVTTQAGRNNMTALDGIASSAIALVASQQKAGASSDQLTVTMGSARQAFVNAAIAAGATTDQANTLANQLGLIPKDVSTAFQTSGAQQAEADAANIRAAYAAIDRLITIRVNTITTNATNPAVGFGLGTGKADGGTIGMANGNTVPGSGSSHVDSVLTMLAPGEEVISNKFGQASMWRPLLKMINAGTGPTAVVKSLSSSSGGAAVQPSNSAQQSSSRDIYADGIGLIGTLIEVAGQQARLVFNQGMKTAATQMDGALV